MANTEQIKTMFDKVAPRYDLLNRLLSFRLDVSWRKQVKRFLPRKQAKIELLDVATGTGDLLFSIVSRSSRITRAVGVDISSEMLKQAERKINQYGFSTPVEFYKGDAQQLPFKDESFDVVTMAFGIRNVEDPTKALKEIRRVLKKEGRVIILEFSLPKNTLTRNLYLFYFRHVLPKIGGLLSGEETAYRYLNTSVEAFPSGLHFVQIMRQAGFVGVRSHRMTLGVAQIYYGNRAP